MGETLPDYIDPETAAAMARIRREREGEAGELVVPGIGTVVDLSDPQQCALALADVREIESMFAGTKRRLTEAIVEASKQRGTKTLHLDGLTATIKGDSVTSYDAEEIEVGLRAAGMPEDRIREIVKETVSYRVVANEAKKAAGANPAYANVIDSHKTTKETDPHVTISRQRVDTSAIVEP